MKLKPEYRKVSFIHPSNQGNLQKEGLPNIGSAISRQIHWDLQQATSRTSAKFVQNPPQFRRLNFTVFVITELQFRLGETIVFITKKKYDLTFRSAGMYMLNNVQYVYKSKYMYLHNMYIHIYIYIFTCLKYICTHRFICIYIYLHANILKYTYYHRSSMCSQHGCRAMLHLEVECPEWLPKLRRQRNVRTCEIWR